MSSANVLRIPPAIEAAPTDIEAPRAIGGPDVVALRTALQGVDAFGHHTGASWLKLVSLLALAGALGVLAIGLPWYGSLAMVPVVALPLTSAVMIGHEAGHRSFAARAWHNELVLHLVFPLLTGLGAQHWKRKHNVLHHGHPNVLGIDDDIDLWPFALEAREYAKASGFRRWFHRNLQGLMFWPLSGFLPFVMRRASIRYSVRALKRGEVSLAWAADVVCQLGHYTLAIIVPGLLVGWLPTLAAYAALWACVGVYLALIFTPAHLGLPITAGRPKGWLHQLESTRNLSMPRWASWGFIGLDHQVEHHLFPTIPHQNMKRASGVFKVWCDERGAPYQSIGYVAGVRDVTRFVATAWRHDPTA